MINDLLDQVRAETDPDARTALAQEINRQFAKECWIMPTSWTTWGIIMEPNVQNIGRDPLPDGSGFLARRRRVPRPGLADAVFIAE